MTELIVVVGLTGVGKTSVIDKAQEKTDFDVAVISYGSKLLKTAKAMGLVENRDELTDMPPEEYSELQQETAERIASLAEGSESDTVIVDTHAALDTPVGYRPGLSSSDVEYMEPDKIIQVHAEPIDIMNRRRNDAGRNRTIAPTEEIEEHQSIATSMAATFSVLSRAPLSRVENQERRLEGATEEMVSVIETV